MLLYFFLRKIKNLNIFSLNTYSKVYSTLTIKYLISDHYKYGLTQITSLHSAVRRGIGLAYFSLKHRALFMLLLFGLMWSMSWYHHGHWSVQLCESNVVNCQRRVINKTAELSIWKAL